MSSKVAFASTVACSILLCLLYTSTGEAATEGTAGASSVALASISVSIPERVIIDSFNNPESICISSNRGGSSFVITGSGSGQSQAYTLSDGVYEIAYSVSFNTDKISARKTESDNCNTGETHKLNVEIAEFEAMRVPAGNYSGSLTLVPEPV